MKLLYVLCWPTVSSHPPLHFTCLVCERAVYTEFWGTISQYTVSLSHGFVTHWFSPPPHHHQQQHHLPSSSYSEEEYTDPFKASTMLRLPWLPRVVFQFSPPVSGLAITRTIWSEWTRAGWPPPWASLVLSAFGRLSWGRGSHLTVLRTISSEWAQFGWLDFVQISPWEFFRTIHIYYKFFIYCISHFNSILFLIQIFYPTASLCWLIPILNNVVWLLFIILILEICSRYFDPVKSNYIITMSGQ